jgi:predicted transcriptional regulator
MRTTLTLDDDVAAQLRRLARETGRPFKQVVNDALRAGLLPQRPSAATEDLSFATYPLGLRVEIDIDRARHLAAELEDDETVRKWELRK